MPTGSRSRTTSAHAGRTQRHRSFPRHALRRVGRFVWRTAGHAVLRSKVGRDRMRSASEKLARSNATVPLPALKTLLAGRAGIRPIRAAPRFSPTISLIQRSSQKKMIERRKKLLKCTAIFCDSFLWPVTVTEWFQQKDSAGMWRRSKVLQGVMVHQSSPAPAP